MIKNVWMGKTKLFDFDFDEKSTITFNEYIKIIES